MSELKPLDDNAIALEIDLAGQNVAPMTEKQARDLTIYLGQIGWTFENPIVDSWAEIGAPL